MRIEKLVHIVICSCLCLFCPVLHVTAQVHKPVRLEFPSSQYSTDFNYQMCGKEGLCTIFPSWRGDSAVINIQHYDTDFNKVHELRISTHLQYEFVGSAYDQQIVYILYQSKIKKKKEPFGILITYSIKEKKADTLSIRGLPTNDISRVSAYNGHLFFVCPTRKSNSNLFFIAAKTDFVKALTLNEVPDYTIDDYLIDTIEDRVITCVNTSSITRDNVIWLCETTLNGEVTHVTDLPDTGNFRFQNSRLVQLGTTKYLIAGTYQIRKGGIDNTASGSYSTVYDNGYFSEPSLHPYQPLSTYTNTNRTAFSEVLYLPNRIYHDSTRYAFITEAFYPEYRYSTTYSYGVPMTESIFVGYQFLNAEVKIFDSNGNLQWEYTFPYDNILTSSLYAHLRVSFFEDKVLFYHVTSENLVTMLTNNDMEIIDPIRSTNMFPNENKIEQTVFVTGLLPWFDDYFLMVGYKNKNTGSSKSRNPVYFINKLRYQ